MVTARTYTSRRANIVEALAEKLKNIEADLDRFEDINQKLTLAQQQQKQVEEKMNDFEALLKRPEAGFSTEQVDTKTARFDKWLRKGKENMELDEINDIAKKWIDLNVKG